MSMIWHHKDSMKRKNSYVRADWILETGKNVAQEFSMEMTTSNSCIAL